MTLGPDTHSRDFWSSQRSGTPQTSSTVLTGRVGSVVGPGRGTGADVVYSSCDTLLAQSYGFDLLKGLPPRDDFRAPRGKRPYYGLRSSSKSDKDLSLLDDFLQIKGRLICSESSSPPTSFLPYTGSTRLCLTFGSGRIPGVSPVVVPTPESPAVEGGGWTDVSVEDP